MISRTIHWSWRDSRKGKQGVRGYDNNRECRAFTRVLYVQICQSYKVYRTRWPLEFVQREWVWEEYRRKQKRSYFMTCRLELLLRGGVTHEYFELHMYLSMILLVTRMQLSKASEKSFLVHQDPDIIFYRWDRTLESTKRHVGNCVGQTGFSLPTQIV